MLKRTAVLLVSPVFAMSALAADMEVLLDPAATVITFELKATMHTVHGTAELKEGTIRFDPSTGIASGEIVVDAASAETGNGKRDRKMHNKVLRSEEFPSIVLRAERIEGTLEVAGKSTLTLTGSMELTGSSHPIQIPLTVWIQDGRVTVEAGLTVPYVEWGLKDPSTFVLRVAKHVEVSIDARGQVLPPEKAR